MTRTLLVAYDLAPASPTRTALAQALMSLGEAWARPLDTVWLVRTRLTPDMVEAELAPYLEGDEGLMVQEARGDAMLTNTSLRWFRPRRPDAMAVLARVAAEAYADGAGDGETLDRAA